MIITLSGEKFDQGSRFSAYQPLLFVKDGFLELERELEGNADDSEDSSVVGDDEPFSLEGLLAVCYA